jgi:hypothetical protein
VNRLQGIDFRDMIGKRDGSELIKHRARNIQTDQDCGSLLQAAG